MPEPPVLYTAGVKLILIVVAVVVIGGSIFADYKWRRWVESRRAEGDQDVDRRT